MRDVPIENPPVEDLGPAMLALSLHQRRFVIGWVATGGKSGARAARGAGYAEERAKITACELLRDTRIQAALKEESERRWNPIAAMAILGLGDLVSSKSEKIKAAAIDSVLDRTGYARRTTQDIRVEHVDERSTADLMALVRKFRPEALPAPPVEGTFTEVRDGVPEEG